MLFFLEVVFLAVCAASGLIAVTVFFLELGDARHIKRLGGATQIAAAAEGETVKVRGAVAGDELLAAPYTGRACVYYRLELYQDSPPFEGTTFVADDSVDFHVSDDSGVALVMSERVEVELVCDIVEMGRATRLSERAYELAYTLGWNLSDLAHVKISEGIIAPNATVDVVGTATREPAIDAFSEQKSERGYRDQPGTTLVFSGHTRVLAPPKAEPP